MLRAIVLAFSQFFFDIFFLFISESTSAHADSCSETPSASSPTPARTLWLENLISEERWTRICIWMCRPRKLMRWSRDSSHQRRLDWASQTSSKWLRAWILGLPSENRDTYPLCFLCLFFFCDPSFFFFMKMTTIPLAWNGNVYSRVRYHYSIIRTSPSEK